MPKFRAYIAHMLLQDIRFGLRTALKNKGVTGLAVTCLAIGIGLNTMMFSVTDGMLIQPLPYHDPDSLVVLHTTQKETSDRFRRPLVARAAGLAGARPVVQRARPASSTEASRSATAATPIAIPARAISHELFPLLGKSAAARPRASPRKTIARAPSRSSSSPTISGSAATTPTRRSSAAPSRSTRARTPSSASCRRSSGFPRTSTCGCRSPSSRSARSAARAAWRCSRRLRDGVTLEQAQQEGGRGRRRTSRPRFPTPTRDGASTSGRSANWAIPDDVTLIILTMMGAVTMVLLIACFNVANLMLARASTPLARDVDPHGARRRARPDHPAAADRERHHRRCSACRSAWRARGAA